jgi:hypothetical protein
MTPHPLPAPATWGVNGLPRSRKWWRGAIGDRTGSGVDHRGLVDLLTRFDEEVATRRASGALVHALRRWRTRHDELLSLAHPDDLIRLARAAHDEGRESKDRVLAALCVEGVNGDDDAPVLLVWLMLPSLLLVRRRLAARSALDTDELDAELLAGLWEAAARVRPGAPYIAKRLVDGARHHAFATIRREEGWTGRIAPLPGGEIGESQTAPADDGEMRDVLSEAVAAGVISEEEADLLRASRAAAPRLWSYLGISESAARSRRLRARRRLLDWLADSSPPRIGTLVGSPQEVPTDSTALRATDGTNRSPL